MKLHCIFDIFASIASIVLDVLEILRYLIAEYNKVSALVLQVRDLLFNDNMAAERQVAISL